MLPDLTTKWWPKDTTNHQDHVIAHVIGATVLGYFILDEALYLLLDIGFIWTIYVDGEMVLLPHPVATGELETNQEVRDQIKTDVDILLTGGADGLVRLIHSPASCQIKEIGFFMNGDQRRLLLMGEEASLVIETSLSSGEIRVAEAL